MQVRLLLETVKLGHSILFLDTDMVLFKNPFDYVRPGDNVLVSRDCEGLDKLNLGTLFFQ